MRRSKESRLIYFLSYNFSNKVNKVDEENRYKIKITETNKEK